MSHFPAATCDLQVCTFMWGCILNAQKSKCACVCVSWYAEVQDLSGYHGNWHGYLNRSDLGEKEWMFCVGVCVFVCERVCVHTCVCVRFKSRSWKSLSDILFTMCIFFPQHVFAFFGCYANQLITRLLVNHLVIFSMFFFAVLASPLLV